MKTINELEQEAKQAREDLNSELTAICGAILAKPLVDSIINAAVAMVTYQFTLGMQEVSGDSDGWIVWNGGAKALTRENVQVKFRNGQDDFGKVLDWNWNHERGEWDIIAYRIVK